MATYDLTEKLYKRLQCYRATARAEDENEFRKLENDLRYKRPQKVSDAIEFLRNAFFSTENACVMCAVSNIANDLFNIHFPRIE